MLSVALEHIVKGIVDHPDDVVIRSSTSPRGDVLEVRVHPDDVGKVIGRQGRIAKEIRTVVRSYAQRTGAKVSVDIVD